MVEANEIIDCIFPHKFSPSFPQTKKLFVNQNSTIMVRDCQIKKSNLEVSIQHFNSQLDGNSIGDNG